MKCQHQIWWTYELLLILSTDNVRQCSHFDAEALHPHTRPRYPAMENSVLHTCPLASGQ